MNQNKTLFGLILGVTLVGFALLAFQSEYLSKVIRSTNSYIVLNNYEVKNSLSEEEFKQLPQDQYILLYDKKDENSVAAKDNIVRILDYVKKDYQVIEISEFTGLQEGITGIIICFENLDQSSYIERVFDYTHKGGSLLFAMRPLEGVCLKQHLDALGIEKLKGMKEEKGLKLLSNVLIQGKGLELDGQFMSNSSLDIELTKEADIHAVSFSEMPMLWENDFGQGKVIVSNATMFQQATSRGYILGAIGLMTQDFIYPIINAKVVFLDDFPSPVPQGDMEKLGDNLKISVEQFYRNMWWPSIVRVAKKYNMIYSANIIACYADHVKGPFISDNTTSEDSLFYFGQEILQNGGELAIHGFNHQSFTYDTKDVKDEGYNVWQSEKDVQEAWRGIYGFVNGLFPKYEFRDYVPPSNILSQEVRAIMPQIAPEVKVISALYGKNEGGGTYNQEYEVAEDGIIEFPRISSGYMEEKDSRWDMYNVISMHGVVSHFIHPDDVLNETRNTGKSWEELIAAYECMWKEIYDKFGWLHAVKISDAATELEKVETTKVNIIKEDAALQGYCNNFKKDMYFILRTNQEVVDTINCSMKPIDKNVYWVYTTSPDFRITFREVK
ncbi:DUF2194 domain-containing protein [Cellulosilyticum ruminicola]|uniref:DUF2194 domain-containing protein n=1 Tax=Cellulosilyticum ruminicola TaxID=425254 RepID=UPI0006CF9E2A|nr:DUF2194 domain-containing protein [Cellulosilyticum ruminicola]